MNKLLILLSLSLLTSCSNAEWSAFNAWGKRHVVKCWSGGVLIYEGSTTGKIENEEHSDGYYFQEEKSGKLVMVSGNCLITVE